MDIHEIKFMSSLRLKMPVVMFCIIIAVTTLSTYFILQTFGKSISTIKRDYVENAVTAIGVNVSMQLRQTHRDMRMLALLPTVQKSVQEIPEAHKVAGFQRENFYLKDILENVKGVHSYYDSLFLANALGEYVIGSRESGLSSTADAEYRLIQESIAHDELHHANLVRSASTNELLLPLILPLSYGEKQGALVSSVRMNELVDIAIRETPHDEIFCTAVVLNVSGISYLSENTKKLLSDALPSFFSQMLASTTGVVTIKKQGEEGIIGYYNVPNTDIYILGVIDESFKSAELEDIRHTMTFTSLAMAIITLISVYFFAGPIARDILKIDAFAKKIAFGKDVSTIDVHRNDELNSLARNLENMVENLKEMVTRSESATKAKSDFLARMSHEIRTPMNGIIGMTYLAMRANPDVRQQQYLERIDNAAKSLLHVINDILDFSKIEAEKMDINPTSFRLETMFSSIRDILLPKCAEKSLVFTYTVDEQVPDIIRTDPVRLTQICTNLCSNAVKFTSRGSVHLHASVQSRTEDSLVLLFSVQDSGIGMSPEEQVHIFESFTQADGTTTRKYGGTGLGLAICKSLVGLLGGSISVESERGKGSSFNFTIQATLGNEAEVEKQGIPQRENLAIIPLDILLVEDNEINQAIALEILNDMGANVTLAQNGQEAVTDWEQGHYDVILMDIQMPVMDGLTAAKHIRASNSPRAKTVPILAMTAHAMSGDKEKSLENGMNDHITKPIDINELRDALAFWGASAKLDRTL